MSNLYRYSTFDGTQDPFALSDEQLMDELSDELMQHGDVQRAMRRLLQRGMRGQDNQQDLMGLRDMMRKLRENRQQHLDKYDLSSVMNELKDKLQEAVDIEKDGLQKRIPTEQTNPSDTKNQSPNNAKEDQPPEDFADLAKNIAQRKLEALNNLPEDMGGAIRQLSDYEFMENDARNKFNELLEMLKQRASESLMQNMSEQMQNTTPDQMNAMKNMLHDLNEMLQDKMEGLDPEFDKFMDKWGQMFGPNQPGNLDELMEMLQSQMGNMQSLLDSLPPDMRNDLMESMNQALKDPELQDQMAQLASLMDYMYPLDDFRQEYPFMGEENISFSQAMRVMDELQKLDQVDAQVRAAERQSNLDLIDEESLENALGEDARQSLERLRELQKELENSGYIRQQGDKMELTPRGIRKIGQKALKDIFHQLKKQRLGLHDVHTQGLFGDLTEDDTKIYEFGDPFHLNMVRTVKNSVLREGLGTPLQLKPDDFEVVREEQMTQSATVIMLDQSRSMAVSGSFDAAKKVSLALHTLIKSQFPRDHLYVVGFADNAWELKGEELLKATWGGYSPGTNMQQALQLARSLLAKHRVGTRQVIMVTDGEPTAHSEAGVPFFSYPPSARTIDETLKEVKRCTKQNITINVFMLEMAYYLVHFVRQITQLNRGRAFFTTPDKLGEYMLVDYMSNKR
ncbi:MAG: VWA domain-containing protein [SAR202 cluster bacterium]|nr:VWA domain-containing protein [SAR202 cluster bacterium]